MKYFVTGLLIITSIYCKAQSADEKAVREVMNKQITAWNNADIEGFMQTYRKNDSLMFVGSKGITYGWDSTLAHYKRIYPDKAAMGKLSFELKELKPLSDIYYFVIGKFLLERVSGNLRGYFTLLFKKINGEWYIVCDHTS